MRASKRGGRGLAMFAAAVLGASPALAADMYWDANGSIAGAGGPSPSGTWGLNNFWTLNSNGTTATAAWNSANTAVFAAGTDADDFYTVNINATQTAAGLRFEEGMVTL